MSNNNNLIFGIVIVVVVFTLLGIFGFWFGDYGMMGGYSTGFMLFGWFFNLLIIILVIVGIYWLMKKINTNKRSNKNV